MLSFITGLPGNGKTLYTLDLVSNYQKAQHEDALKENPESQPREIYQHGITDLAWDWTTLDNVEGWYNLPTGAIIVIDEAQKHFPVMSPAAKRPDHYMRFDMHRHKGHDIFLITQDSQLIDTNVRAMCGRHIHLVRPFGMQYSNTYEWPSVQNTRSKDLSKDAMAIKSKWGFKKELFSVYKSAEVHTHKRSLPLKKLLFLGATIVIPLVLFAIVFSFLKGDKVEENTAQVFDESGVPVVRSSPGLYSNLSRWIPLVPDVPMSAPIYTEHVRIQDVPRVTGCMTLEGVFMTNPYFECNCTDQQGNKVEVSDDFCRKYVQDGSFDPTIGGAPARRSMFSERS